MDQNEIQLDDLFTVDQLAARYPDILTVSALRWQLRFREENGLEKACIRIGKKLLISQSRYQAWLAGLAK